MTFLSKMVRKARISRDQSPPKRGSHLFQQSHVEYPSLECPSINQSINQSTDGVLGVLFLCELTSVAPTISNAGALGSDMFDAVAV
jgi:hypothetical protein